MTDLHRNAATIQERLRDVGLDVEPRQLDTSARTAAEAAASLGTTVGQIVKSLVFFRGEDPVIVLCAGDRRVDAERLGLRVAKAKEAKAATGLPSAGSRRLATTARCPRSSTSRCGGSRSCGAPRGRPTPCSPWRSRR